MKNILLTNDDGYEALGLNSLKNALLERLSEHFGGLNIFILAPFRQKSACSHSLSLHHPLRLKKIHQDHYALDDGTPSDCVYVALSKFFDKKFDLVISGINHGANLGEDVSYSGTCAGAMEAVLQGTPALASSLYYTNGSIEKYGFDLACELTCAVAKKLLENPNILPKRQFFSLNTPAVPKSEFKGLRATYSGVRSYDTKLDIRTDPRGGEYIWLGEPEISTPSKDDLNSDIGAVFAGFASLSAIKLDLCAHESADITKNFINTLEFQN